MKYDETVNQPRRAPPGCLASPSAAAVAAFDIGGEVRARVNVCVAHAVRFRSPVLVVLIPGGTQYESRVPPPASPLFGSLDNNNTRVTVYAY